jgi:hypothetical protein
MSAAIGMDLGAEMTAGGHAGKGQSPMAVAGLGKGLSTNWLRPASGNLATGSVSEAPSFRSSWQTQVNAWRGAPRGTNGVESQDASEAGTADTMNGVSRSLAAKDELTSVSAQGSSSGFQSNNASTPQNVPVPDVAGQKETWPQRSYSASEITENGGAQTAVSESADATTTERPGTANRSRVGPAIPHAERKNTAQATSAGAQAIAPTIEAPIQIPAAPVRSEIPKLAETVETVSAPGPSLAPSNWHSTQVSRPAQLSRPAELSGLAQLSGPTQFSGSTQSSGSVQLSGSARPSSPAQLSGPQLPSTEEFANTAAANLASAGSVSGTSAGAPTHTMHTGPAIIQHNAAENQATHQTAASSLDNDDEPAASQQITSLSSPEIRSAESWREPSIAHAAVSNESFSGQSVAASSTGNLSHPAAAGNVASSAAPVATVPGAVQAGSTTVQESSKQFTDRATTRAVNRDATAEGSPGATQVSAAQPAVVDAAASSGIRIAGASQISMVPASHDQPAATAASAAATTQDTFSALDAGASPVTPAWTRAGSQHAEAGFRDPALGWVSVRADLNGGGIHATLVPSTAEAAQALDGHLAGLSSHLIEQQSPVASLSVASLTMASPSGSGTENGMGQRMQQGAEGNRQGNAPDEAQAATQQNARRTSSASVLNAPGQTRTLDSLTHPGDLRGTHISVMA